MIILVSSTIDCIRKPETLGAEGQGHYFLKLALLPIFEEIGTVIEVDSGLDAERLCEEYRSLGRLVVMCFFGLPTEINFHLSCPVIPIFAWPFDLFPNENDSTLISEWVTSFSATCGAITFSRQSADALSQLMGEKYPVLVSPAQPWELFCGLCPPEGLQPTALPRVLSFSGHLLDSPRIGLSVDGLALTSPPEPEPEPEPSNLVREVEKPTVSACLYLTALMLRGWWNEAFGQYAARPEVHFPQDALPCVPTMDIPHGQSLENRTVQNIKLYGVVYTGILRAEDELTRWLELVSAFCWTFRNQPNATLILKFSHYNPTSGRIALLTALSRLSPFRCRVIAINAFLDAAQYEALIAVSHFLVQPSLAEASALTAQEFLSAGRPVIGPAYAALADWLTPENALLIEGSLQPMHWSKDPDKKLHYSSLRLNWASLCCALEQSYRITQEHSECYQEMSKSARSEMARRASKNHIKHMLGDFISRTAPKESSGGGAK